jgi:hypothetical protein
LRRVDRLTGIVAASLALGGCMVIYPDPELPDVVARWFEGDCRPGTGNVAMALVDFATDSRSELAVPCTDLTATFADVARERYRFEALLLDDGGEAFSRSDTEADLRDGFDEQVDLYFGAFSNFRVAWVFDMGATCESLGADGMSILFSNPDMSPAFQSFAACGQTPFFGMFRDGTYTLRLRAYAGTTLVATSPESEEFEIADPELTDLGVITLSP